MNRKGTVPDRLAVKPGPNSESSWMPARSHQDVLVMKRIDFVKYHRTKARIVGAWALAQDPDVGFGRYGSILPADESGVSSDGSGFLSGILIMDSQRPDGRTQR